MQKNSKKLTMIYYYLFIIYYNVLYRIRENIKICFLKNYEMTLQYLREIVHKKRFRWEIIKKFFCKKCANFSKIAKMNEFFPWKISINSVKDLVLIYILSDHGIKWRPSKPLIRNIYWTMYSNFTIFVQ